MNRALFVAATLLAAAPAFVHAQSVELSAFAGAGATQSLSQPGVDRSAGPTFLGGIELARPTHAGLLGRVSLRAEAGFASQRLSVDGDVVSGDVHTVHGALALRVALAHPQVGARRFEPYAVVGAAWARPSTRFALTENPGSTPGARFEQVTHENVPGTMLGAGVAWVTQRAAVRGEARLMSLLSSDGTTSTLPVFITIAVPVRR